MNVVPLEAIQMMMVVVFLVPLELSQVVQELPNVFHARLVLKQQQQLIVDVQFVQLVHFQMVMVDVQTVHQTPIVKQEPQNVFNVDLVHKLFTQV